MLLVVVEPVVSPAVSVPLEPAAGLVVEPGVVPAVPVPLEPAAGLIVEPGVASAVPVALERPVADDGLGHKFLYTNCSGAPLQALADLALNVPFEYIQQVPEAYGELPGLCGLKTT